MAVLLPNCELTVRVRPHPFLRDAHGTPVPSNAPPEVRGPYPGAATNRPETGAWSLRLDPRTWPVEAGDEVTDGTRTWVLAGEPQLHAVPGHDAVDYVAARGILNPPETP